ncbi:MAG: NifB/NifX family molybdenum-iron cluster-binding protein [Dehalococcoidia bacterium]
MKVAVSAKGQTLDAEVDPRFGRCQYLIFVDTENMEYEAHNNADSSAGGGAGIATAQVVANRGVQAVLTGNIGPNAHRVLAQAGIEILTGVSGSVKEAVERYKSGSMNVAHGPTVGAHAGIGKNAGDVGYAGNASTEIEDLKSRADSMKRQMDDMISRINDLEKRIK